MTNLVNIMFLEMSLAELAQTELVERLLEGQHLLFSIKQSIVSRYSKIGKCDVYTQGS